MQQFISLEIYSAMNLDALESSHPISVDVKDPSQIFEIFDSISYNKGIIHRSYYYLSYFITLDCRARCHHH